MTFAVRPIGLVKTGFVWRPTISADVTNWVLYSQAIAAGWDGVQPLDAVVTVASGIVLSANSTSLYGFDTGSGFPVGTSLQLIMPGYVCGMGGAGAQPPNAVGNPGGAALRARYAITVDAAGGVIAGGGGGGGSGGNDSANGGGGGGRTGKIDSAGGFSSGGAYYSGKAGTFDAGGNGGNGGAGGTTANGADAYMSTGGGGGGGGWGSAGGRGNKLSGGFNNGGLAGAAVVGNSYITWINTGTRYGSIT